MSRAVVRGNRVYFSFVFYDQDDALATVISADLQLTYPGNVGFETATITLTADGDNWTGEWDSSVARAGWVEYHAHALGSGSAEFAQDSRFRLTANRASLDHDTIPASGTISDYELLP